MNKTHHSADTLFARIRLLVLDVDGVLTRGEIIYDDRGGEWKIFNVKDGLGIALLSKLGIPTIFLSARNSPVLQKRAQDMKVVEVIGGILPKESLLESIEEKYRVPRDQICFIGDDLIDLRMIERVGAGVAVADSPEMVKSAARYVTARKGGDGAVREIVDLIVRAQGLEEKLLEWLRNPK
ncbi:MAG: HAD hydrolase family protein [Candidatus Omnitrophica bacterium]|nr:HAD hydrolase family protein [Candidatus Omnitrophota bacterium]